MTKSRPARVGERLVSAKFPGTLTHGLAAVNEPNVAACLLPGAKLVFDEEIRCDQGWSVSRKAPTGKTAEFCQINRQKPDAHHDALKLADGRVVLIHALNKGQLATVESIPGQRSAAVAGLIENATIGAPVIHTAEATASRELETIR